MDDSREFYKDLLENNNPHHSGISTPGQKSRKKGLDIAGQHNKLSTSGIKKSPKSSHYPSFETIEQRTLISEEVRIKGNEKLVYLKQCHHKNYTPMQIFSNYPFSNMEIFTFNDQQLRDEQGNINASIIEDEKGIHLVEQYKTTNSSRYITSEQQKQLNVFNGLAVSLFQNGTIFEGMYHNGKCCGQGYELQPNGNTYIGSFKDGIKNGNGTFYWFCNNEMYVGEWHGGLPHGLGVYIGKDRYEGSFLNGLKFGFGEETFSNGDKYIGEFVNSVADGYGEYYWSDNSVYKGDFKQGVRHGYGIWHDEKEIYKGYYRLDKKEGFGVYIWRNKQVYKGQFRDDFREGYGEFYSIVNNAQKLIYKGCWQRGKKCEEGPVNDSVVKQLHIFLESSDLYDAEIDNNSKKERKRVGHKNCIPQGSPPKNFNSNYQK